MGKRDLWWGCCLHGHRLHACTNIYGPALPYVIPWLSRTICQNAAAWPVSVVDLAGGLPRCRKCLAELRDGEKVRWGE